MGLCKSKSVHKEFEDPSQEKHHSAEPVNQGKYSGKDSLYENNRKPEAGSEDTTSFTSPLRHREVLRHDEYDEEDVPFATDIVTCASINMKERSPVAFASWSEGTVSMHDVESKQLLGHFAASKKSVNKLAVSSAANVVATASRDATVGFWKWTQRDPPQPDGHPVDTDTREGEYPYSFEKIFEGQHGMTVSAVDITERGGKAVSGSRDTSLRIWDITQQKVISELKNKPRNIVTCLRWLPPVNGYSDSEQEESVLFAQGAEDLHVRLWDCRTHRPKEVLTLDGYVYFPLDLDISADGNYICTSSKGFDIGGCELKLWDIRFPNNPVDQSAVGTNDMKLRYSKQNSFHGHTKDAIACSFLPTAENSLLVCSASKDSTIRLWEGGIPEQQCVYTHVENGSAGFSAMEPVKALHDNSPSAIQLLASTFEGDVFSYDVDCNARQLSKQS